MILRLGHAVVSAAVVGVVGGWAMAGSSSVVVSGAAAGVTPEYLGFNNGHYRSGSDTGAWVDYSGMNAMRVWAAASDYTSTTSANYGNGVTTQAQFDVDRAAVRADPESNAFINIAGINWDKTQTGRNAINLDYVLGQLQQKGVNVLLQTTRSTAYDYTGWGGKWEQWKWYYTIAYWAAKNYGVQAYQMYNEPDLAGISIAEWTDRMKVASDAIHAAIADVDADFGKSLTADVYAPVAAGTTSTIDTWGKSALNGNRTDFEGNATSYDLFDTYDVHRYNSTGSAFASDQQLFDQKIPAYNASGQNLPVTYSEFNRQNTSSFSASPNSLDTPSVYTDLASIFIGAMSQDVKGMYAFKFNQTFWTNSSGVEEAMKTGFYYVDDSATAKSSDLHNTTGPTQGAEVMRLADKAFAGQRPRYAISTGNSLNDAAGSFDADSQRYYYYSVNHDTAAANVTVNLANWNVMPGQTITVEEVSGVHHGDVSRTMVVPANKTITFSQTAQSLFLLTIPDGAVQSEVDLGATADASVSNAAPSANNGTAATALVGRNATSTADEAAYLKFSLAGTSKANVSRAVLWLTGQNIADSDATTLYLYGIDNNAWTETGINWSNAPDLAGASDAKMGNVGVDAFPLGELTYNSTSGEFGVDVTDFVRAHPTSDLSFAVIREQRFAGDADTSVISINTREAGTGKPTLAMSMYAEPVYNWHMNGDGVLSAGGNLDVGSSPNGVGAVLNLGAFITSPHTVSVTGDTVLGTLNFNNLNGYTLAGPGKVTLDNGAGMPMVNVYQGAHRIVAPLVFAKAGGLVIAAGAQLDVAGNGLLLSQAGTTVATLRGYLLSGQLMSSSAVLGYVVDSTGEIVVRGAVYGDANLDGVITADDYALIDRGFARHLSDWQDGDFNYDGVVNGEDYFLMDQEYLEQGGAMSAGLLAEREAQFGAGYVTGLLESVPEPSGVVGLGVWCWGVKRPRRSRR
jgi:hypothetical protein